MRSGNPITDDKLVIITMNAILSTEKFPCANEDWEELDVSLRMWLKWKEMYQATDKKAKIKMKDSGGKYQFISNNAAFEES